MLDKDQKKRTSGAEEALVKQFLESRDDAPLILRNHFLQFELTEDEKEFLKGLNKDLIPVLVKMITPKLDRDVPLGQEASAYSRLVMLEQINPDVGYLHLEANDILKIYLEEQLLRLTDDIEVSIVLEDLPKPIENDKDFKRVTNVLAYNLIVPIVEGRIKSLIDLVTEPEETPEEKEARLKSESAE